MFPFAGAPDEGQAVRRKEKEITDRIEIEAVLFKVQVYRLGMAEDRRPHIVNLGLGC